MAADKYPLSLVISAVDRATAPIKKINGALSKLTAPAKGIGTALGKVGTEAASLGLKFAGIAAAAGFGLYSIVKSAEEAGSKLEDNSKRVGLSVNEYASLQHAAKLAGIENEAFASSFDTFNKGIGQARAGTGRFLAFLKKTGPGLAKQIQGAKSNEEALSFMTDALHRIKDPARRAALATAAFGDAQMGQLLGQGSEAVQKFRTEFMKLAGPQDEFASRAGDMGDALDRLDIAFGGTRNAIMAKLFPALGKLADAAGAFLVKNRDGLQKWAEKAGAAISKWVDSGGIDRLATGIQNVTARVSAAVDRLGGLENVAKLVALAMSSNLIGAVAQAGFAIASFTWKVGALILANTNLGRSLAFTQALMGGGFVGAIKTAILLAGAWTTSLAGVAVAAWAAVAPFLPFIVAAGALGAAGYAVYKGWEPLKELFSDLGQTWKATKELFSSPVDSLKTAGSWWGKQLGLGGPSAAAPMPDVNAARPGATSAKTELVVTMKNLPPGTKVATEGVGPDEMNMSYGPAMAGG